MDDTKDAPLQPGQTEETPKDPADNLTPEHPRFKQVIEKLHEKDETIIELQKQMAELKDSIQERQDKTGSDEITAEEKEALAKIDREMNRKYLTKDELESSLRQDRLARELERLSDRYDGTNGYPKFVSEDVVAYAAKHDLPVDAAYREMHWDTIVDIEAKKRAKDLNAPNSEKATGKDTDGAFNEYTPEQIANMSDAEYEQHREKIITAFRKQAR